MIGKIMRTSAYFYNIKEEVFYRTLGLYAALTPLFLRNLCIPRNYVHVYVWYVRTDENQE